MTTQAAIHKTIGAQKGARTVAPKVVQTLELQATDLSDDGTAEIGFTILDVRVDEVDDTPLETMEQFKRGQFKKAVTSALGARGTYTVTSSGVVSSMKMQAAPDTLADPITFLSIQRLLHQTATPFPSEEVGVGAKWTVTQDVDEDGIRIEQVSTFELTSMKGSTVVLDIGIEKSGSKQMVQSPRGGLAYQLHRFAASGKGNARSDLTAFVPLSYEIETAATLETTLGSVPQEVEIALERTTKMHAK